MQLQNIGDSWRKDKRLYAYFVDHRTGKEVITHFGLKYGNTYIDHGDDNLKENYIKRHRVNEEHLWKNKPMAAATLSRYILWGDSKSIDENVDKYKRLFAM